MAEIIVTFLQKDTEKDMKLPNHVACFELMPYLIEEMHGSSKGTMPDLEVSFDQKWWYKVEKEAILEGVGVWDGAFLRLSETFHSSLKPLIANERVKETVEDDQKEGTENISSDYVWKLIE